MKHVRRGDVIRGAGFMKKSLVSVLVVVGVVTISVGACTYSGRGGYRVQGPAPTGEAGHHGPGHMGGDEHPGGPSHMGDDEHQGSDNHWHTLQPNTGR